MRFKDHGLCIGISTNSERPPYCFFRYINIQTRLLILDNVDLPLKFHLSRGWLIITTRKQPCYTTGQLKTGTIYPTIDCCICINFSQLIPKGSESSRVPRVFNHIEFSKF